MMRKSKSLEESSLPWSDGVDGRGGLEGSGPAITDSRRIVALRDRPRINRRRKVKSASALERPQRMRSKQPATTDDMDVLFVTVLEVTTRSLNNDLLLITSFF